MAREQKARNNPSHAGKGNNQASQTKSKQQATVVAPQQEDSTIASAIPAWPAWPTSKPGPHATTQPGMHAFNGFRPEQVCEVGYNQETGEPGSQGSLSANANQQTVGQNVSGKRKRRA